MKIKVQLFLKSTSEGGRTNPIYSGFRPSVKWGINHQSDGILTVLEKDQIFPGENGLVEIKILNPIQFIIFKNNESISVYEGHNEIATGEIIEIITVEYKIGDLVKFNEQDAEILEFSKVFGIEKATIKLIKTNEVLDVKVDQLKDSITIFSKDRISFLSIAAKIKAEVEKQGLLSPFESNIIPLPHQILALEKVMSSPYLRFLMADEVGMGKTIEAGLVLKELKLRGIVKRTLIIVPKSAMLQWQQEMKTHFNESFQIYDTETINTFAKMFSRIEAENEANIFTQNNQLIVSMDSLKPLDGRQGWTKNKVEEYNKYRIESVINADFDLLIIDECHKVGGSNQLVGRFQMADILTNAIPNVLLLSATPHRGKSDHFRRILQLLNADAFAGEGMPTISELEPYVIRTEKRQAIDYNGKPLFNERNTQKVIVEYDSVKHSRQQALYSDVTKYVVEGFNLATQTKNTSYGFVMLLFQRLVSSSTQAILDSMKKRVERLTNQKHEFTKEIVIQNLDEFSYEGQLEMDFEQKINDIVENAQINFNEEIKILNNLIKQAQDCLQNETDSKVEYLLSKLIALKLTEGLDAKVLIFTEFVSTQNMLKYVLETRGGYNCEVINGSMDFDQRIDALKKFKADTQILISTDAAGESLNMQFAHIVINYDLPWNPMIVEQRIGRVDRIGQKHPVIALNLLLDNSVDKRVFEVIETKLNQIMNDLGIDKTSDVLDSTIERDSIKKLYLTSLLEPARFEMESSNWLEEIKMKLQNYKSTENVLPTLKSKEIKPELVDDIKHNPLPNWLESLTKHYLKMKNIPFENVNDYLKFKFNTNEEILYTFDIKNSINNPIPEPLSLQHEIIQYILSEAIPFTESQQIPIVKLRINSSSTGIWALWHLNVKNEFDTHNIIKPLFITETSENFQAFAQEIWTKIIQDNSLIISGGVLNSKDSKTTFTNVSKKAEEILETTFNDLKNKIINKSNTLKLNKQNAFVFQRQQINRIGIENIKASRLRKLEFEINKWNSSFEVMNEIIPSLKCLLMLKVIDG